MFIPSLSLFLFCLKVYFAGITFRACKALGCYFVRKRGNVNAPAEPGCCPGPVRLAQESRAAEWHGTRTRRVPGDAEEARGQRGELEPAEVHCPVHLNTSAGAQVTALGDRGAGAEVCGKLPPQRRYCVRRSAAKCWVALLGPLLVSKVRSREAR